MCSAAGWAGSPAEPVLHRHLLVGSHQCSSDTAPSHLPHRNARRNVALLGNRNPSPAPQTSTPGPLHQQEWHRLYITMQLKGPPPDLVLLVHPPPLPPLAVRWRLRACCQCLCSSMVWRHTQWCATNSPHDTNRCGAGYRHLQLLTSRHEHVCGCMHGWLGLVPFEAPVPACSCVSAHDPCLLLNAEYH
jgi:hypothetical protein